MTRARPAVVGLLLGTVLLASCGAETVPMADPFGNSTWRLVAAVVDGTSVRLVDTHPVTLRGDDDSVGGTSACNHYGARLSIEGETVTIDEISMTEMACPDDGVMGLEAAYLGALGRVGTATLDGGHLVLTGDGVTLRFEPVEPEPDASLVGPRWSLDTMVDGETVSTPAADAWIRFEADGGVGGNNGCNAFGGAYDPTAGFADLYQTLMGCFDARADQEAYFMSVLASDPTLTIEGSRLTITAPDGRALVFRVSSE